eukprot:TRINITY_DN31946_c0_g1_i2.p1 TRINITY_DN31946_c0_g1~~TRINITY_DN31946_c0_g1_i2.p1  ORF type:complete len:564 (+),score=131.47 TRINITY_DN31946_c0_g1_i2:69-1760(+)
MQSLGILKKIAGVCRRAVVQNDTGGAGLSAEQAAQHHAHSGHLLAAGSYHLGEHGPGDSLTAVFCAAPPPSAMNTGSVSRLVKIAFLVVQDLKNGMQADFLKPVLPDGHLAAPGYEFVVDRQRVRLLFSEHLERNEIDAFVQSALDQRMPPQGGNSDNAQSAEAVPKVDRRIAGIVAREVSLRLLEAVPSQDDFRVLLRFVRHWAKRRGIFGNELGFLGGVAWAIACARVCQMYQGEPTESLYARFFETLATWDWRKPLGLLPRGMMPAADESQVSPGDDNSGKLIRIVLPIGRGGQLSAQPHIRQTTSQIIFAEVQRVRNILMSVPHPFRSLHGELFAPLNILEQQRHFLRFDVLASSEDVFLDWYSWCSGHQHALVSSMENRLGSSVKLWPSRQSVTFKHADWSYAQAFWMGICPEKTVTERNKQREAKIVDLREAIGKFLEVLDQWPNAQKYPGQFDLVIRHDRLTDMRALLTKARQGDLSGYGEDHALRRKSAGPQSQGGAANAAGGALNSNACSPCIPEGSQLMFEGDAPGNMPPWPAMQTFSSWDGASAAPFLQMQP